MSWKMVNAWSVDVGSPASAQSWWRVAVVRRLLSAKLMRGDPSRYGAYPGYTRASSNASRRVTRRWRKGPSCAQSPFLYRGWTRLAHSGRRRMVPVTMSHRQAARRHSTGRVRVWYASAGSLSTPGITPYFERSRARWSSGMLEGVCSMALRCSRLKIMGTCSRMVLLVWGSSSGRASLCWASNLSRTDCRTVS